MPTGYTVGVQSGEISTLRDYALRCARGFGALIMMRDEPMDAKIPERFELNTKYHDEEIVAAIEGLDAVPALSVPECDEKAAFEYELAVIDYRKKEKERFDQRSRYDEMLSKIEAWEIPEDLNSLRDFMAEQIRSSIEFDCRFVPDPPRQMTGEAWRTKQLEKAARELSYHADERIKEISRTEDRNKWLSALWSALPPE